MDGTTLLMRRLSTLWIYQCKKVREWGSLAGRQKRETIASVVAAENIDMRKNKPYRECSRGGFMSAVKQRRGHGRVLSDESAAEVGWQC